MTNISDKATIIAALHEAVEAVCDYISRLNETEFIAAPEGKWNAGQQLDHLIRSIKPLNLAYSLPAAFLKLRFGVSNRPSKTYQGLVDKYESKLALGGRASGRFVPTSIDFQSRERFCKKYLQEKEKLNRKIARLDEDFLDKYILPHPLLGMLTLREMLFFTIYHNYHHLNLMKKYLQQSQAVK